MAENVDKKKLDDFYKLSDKYLYRLMSHDEEYLGPYISFVEKYAQSKKLILDLGCGTGKSSYLLSQLSHFVVGLDISFKFLRMNSSLCNTNLILVAGDAVKLPFGDSTFDVVASNDFIEHVLNAELVLDEMDRLLKKNGLLIIRSENLISPFTSIARLAYLIMGRRSKSPAWGKTILQAIKILARNCLLNVKKILSSKVEMSYRVPDLINIGEDAESVYLSNQIDLKKFFSMRKFEFMSISVGRPGHQLTPKLFPAIAPMIGFVAMKR